VATQCIGGVGRLSVYFVRDPQVLQLSMIGVGIAWASILSLPCALLSNNLLWNKMGVYMGILNFLIVNPQPVAAGAATMPVDRDAEPAT